MDRVDRVDSVSIWLVLVLAGGLLSSALTVTAAEAPEGFPALPSVPVPELISHYPDAVRNDAANLAVLYAPPTKKILRQMMPDKNILSDGATASISLAGNEHEAVQIVLAPLWDKAASEKVIVWVSPLCHQQTGELAPGAEVRWNPVGYWGHQKNNRIIGTSWPDILLPASVADEGFSARGEQLQPIWVDVFVPAGTPAGDYQTTVNFRIGNPVKFLAIPISVHVYDFAIPTRRSIPMTIGGTIPATRDLIYEYGMVPRRITQPGPPLDLWGIIKEGEYREFAEVKPIIQSALAKLHAAGGRRFMMPVPHFKGDKGTTHPVGGVFSHDVIFDQADAAYIVRYHREFAQWLREKGLLQDGFVLIWDEPAPSRFPQMHTIRELIRQADPEIRCFVHAGLHRELMDDVDIWDTGIWQWHKDRELAREIIDGGTEMWWYNTPAMQCDPAMDLLSTRLLFWSIWKHGIQGCLHWTGDNFWYSGKLGTLVRDGDTTDCWMSNGPGEYLGGGTFAYPIPGMDRETFMRKGWRALPSIRLEVIRDGLEDYEYFVLLRNLIDKAKAATQPDAAAIATAKKLLAVPAEIESDNFHPEKLTHFTRDSTLVREHRDRIARAIESLTVR